MVGGEWGKMVLWTQLLPVLIEESFGQNCGFSSKFLRVATPYPTFPYGGYALTSLRLENCVRQPNGHITTTATADCAV